MHTIKYRLAYNLHHTNTNSLGSSTRIQSVFQALDANKQKRGISLDAIIRLRCAFFDAVVAVALLMNNVTSFHRRCWVCTGRVTVAAGAPSVALWRQYGHCSRLSCADEWPYKPSRLSSTERNKQQDRQRDIYRGMQLCDSAIVVIGKKIQKMVTLLWRKQTSSVVVISSLRVASRHYIQFDGAKLATEL